MSNKFLIVLVLASTIAAIAAVTVPLLAYSRSDDTSNSEKDGRRLHQGLCVPSACSKTACPLMQNVSCVNERCDCQARFIRSVIERKIYHDVTDICMASHFIPKSAYSATNSTVDLDEDLPILEIYKEFNKLVTSLLSDIISFWRTVSITDPTERDVNRLRLAMRTLSALNRAAREDDANAKRLALLNVIPKGQNDGGFMSAFSADQLDAASSASAVIVRNFKFATDVLRDMTTEEGVYGYGSIKNGYVALSNGYTRKVLSRLIKTTTTIDSAKTAVI
ncbi:hypothetical protein BV898_00116 [Hypsibius exemplaris]|uniref:Uncharacterized protein n=1 Tax=Hypsibius exemplaris TaxID=2072580 RepID=A0A1W0XER4_HYPEX|nr:hypothetical protein BV898_00116 [Hypsibius exemplaris]